jgi:hypothetical protein
VLYPPNPERCSICLRHSINAFEKNKTNNPINRFTAGNTFRKKELCI